MKTVTIVKEAQYRRKNGEIVLRVHTVQTYTASGEDDSSVCYNEKKGLPTAYLFVYSYYVTIVLFMMNRPRRGIVFWLILLLITGLLICTGVWGYVELQQRDLQTQEQERQAWDDLREAQLAPSVPVIAGDEIIRNAAYQQTHKWGVDIYRNGPVEVVIVGEQRVLTEQEMQELCQGEEDCARVVRTWHEDRSQELRKVEKFLVSGELADANNIHSAFITDVGGYASVAGKVFGMPVIAGLSNARAVLTYEGQDRTPYITIRIYGKTPDRRFVSIRMNVAEEVNTQMEAIFRTCRHLEGERFWNCARSELRVDMAITNSAWELLEGVIKQL